MSSSCYEGKGTVTEDVLTAKLATLPVCGSPAMFKNGGEASETATSTGAVVRP